MFYPLSKILTALTLPSTLVAVVIGLGLLLSLRQRTARAGKRLALTGLAMLVLLGLSPLGNALVLPLEQRAAALAAGPQPGRITGIIILGGFEDGWVSAGRPGLAVNESAERLTESVRLARLNPEARVVFTGGTGALLVAGQDAGQAVRRYLQDVGISTERIVIEDKSRNTHENAMLTRALVAPRPGQHWLLVTSAYHMPRSVGVFRQAGFTVQAHPVDFRTRDAGDALRPLDSLPDGLKRVDLALREYAGLLVYWLSGRSSSPWPAPETASAAAGRP